MSPRGPDVPAVLARHGIDPDADAATLLAELRGRGWAVHVEDRKEGGRRRQPRFRVLASRPRPEVADGQRPPSAVIHQQGSGRTEAEALGQVLAAVLEREG